MPPLQCPHCNAPTAMRRLQCPTPLQYGTRNLGVEPNVSDREHEIKVRRELKIKVQKANEMTLRKELRGGLRISNLMGI